MLGKHRCRYEDEMGRCGQPVYYDNTDFCYYHEKIRKGLMDKAYEDVSIYVTDKLKEKSNEQESRETSDRMFDRNGFKIK